MLQWQEVDPTATYPSERYRAVSGKHEYRIFNDPEERHGEGLAWILGSGGPGRWRAEARPLRRLSHRRLGEASCWAMGRLGRLDVADCFPGCAGKAVGSPSVGIYVMLEMTGVNVARRPWDQREELRAA
jgi:hypothetical protein